MEVPPIGLVLGDPEGHGVEEDGPIHPVPLGQLGIEMIFRHGSPSSRSRIHRRA